jgi:hypothetical protein
MLIDCDTCQVRGPACGDCVVTVLLSAPPVSAPLTAGPGLEFDDAETGALEVLAEHGLVPPLRLAPAPPEQRHPRAM